MLECAFVGSPDTVRGLLQDFLQRTGADELMVSCTVFEHAARLRSYELLAGIAQELESARSPAVALA